MAYANVHTTMFPGGEIRAQLRSGKGAARGHGKQWGSGKQRAGGKSNR